MSALSSFVFALLVLLSRSPAVDLSDPEQVRRLEVAAEDIALVAILKDGAPFRGEARVEALAAALVATAMHESALRADVDSCAVAGDEGRSVSMFQLHSGRARGGHSRAEVCANRTLAAWLAAGVLGTHGRGTVGGMFRGYVTGDGRRDTRTARDRCVTWERLTRRFRIAGSCSRPAIASFAAPPRVPAARE